MANERITESLVRDMLERQGYFKEKGNITVEEQKSSNSEVNKLLKNASKSGGGKGYPEFILQFKDDTDFLIVIECKATTSQHESPYRNNPKDYAVDGVLHYAKFLSKKYDILAIAVSGQNEKELRLTHFLHRKEFSEPQELKKLKREKILPYSDYQNLRKEQTKTLDDEQLVEFAIKLNEELHSYSLPETERCVFVSCVLTAIQDRTFRDGYHTYEKNKKVMEGMLTACRTALEKQQLDEERINVILHEYGKIKNNEILIGESVKRKKQKKEEPNTILKDLIKSLKEDVFPSINKNNFDVLGKFYREFIRYAGSDAKTGLVLTPAHITDFFCDVVELRYDDVVYDPCCGTGGFLVAAMKNMVKQTPSESEQKNIKTKRLVGIEKRADMFAHACSNMMMRGDGRSNIFNGDCLLDSDLIKKIKRKRPAVSFLNPPYDVGADGQLEFVEHALDMLTKGGKCVSICQMSTVVSNQKEVVEVRRRLLANHTLKAVFSMPTDLFHPVGVVTCVLFFQAGTPHPLKKEVFLGYFRDDGHVKKKNKGRVDTGTWKDKKKEMLLLYQNNKKKAGLSATHALKAEDEWCAESYMETDYNKLTEEDFIKTIKNYVAFEYLQESSTWLN